MAQKDTLFPYFSIGKRWVPVRNSFSKIHQKGGYTIGFEVGIRTGKIYQGQHSSFSKVGCAAKKPC
jgi:hypothetical protein